MLAYAACLMLVASTWVSLAQDEVIVGWASQYAENVFPRVVQLRQKWGQLPGDLSVYDGFVATRSCGEIGSVVWLRPLGTQVWETFLVADCASRSDSRWQDGLSGYEWMLAHGVTVEVDHETAARWETLGRGIQIEMTHDCPLSIRARRLRQERFRQRVEMLDHLEYQYLE